MTRLVEWARRRKPVWNCLECTAIGGRGKATPKQVKAEAWLAIVSGSRGLVYFVHQFKPKFDEHALLDDPEMLAAVTELNGQIHELAPVLNGPTPAKVVTVTTAGAKQPIAAMTKADRGATYVFAVSPSADEATGTFNVPGVAADAAVTVIGESRTLRAAGGKFQDRFAAWDVHLYRIDPPKAGG